MTARRDAMDRWVTDHPASGGVDVTRAAHRGSGLFRRWLFLRAAVGVLLGAALVAGLVGLRFLAGSVLGGRVTAVLVVSPTSGNAPLRATMTGSGSTAGQGAEIASFQFNFGDGHVLQQQAATTNHTYKAPGAYVVTLTVTDSHGRSADTIQEVTVTQPEPGGPTAKLGINPSSGPAPLRITARASASKSGKGAKLTSYEFDFGDGTIRTQPSETISHTYTAPGTFTVRLTVTNSAGRSDETTHKVGVFGKDRMPTGPTPRLKVARSSDPDATPLTVVADGSGSTVDGRAAYVFDFGDGTRIGPHGEPTAQHTYQAADIYRVTLTVVDPTGTQASTGTNVTVG